MKKFAFLLLFTSLCYGQATRWDAPGSQTVSGSTPPGAFTPVLAVPGATISFCEMNAAGTACSGSATTYTNASATAACGTATPVVLRGTSTCVATSDAQGNFGGWFLSGLYGYTMQFSNGSVYGPYPFSVGAGGGGGGGGGGGAYTTIRQYGAKCDGVTDDSAAILASLTANSFAIFPADATCATSTVELPSNSELFGLSSRTSNVTSVTPGNDLFTCTGTQSSHKTNISLHGLAFYQASAATNFAAALNGNFCDEIYFGQNTVYQMSGIVMSFGHGYPGSGVDTSTMSYHIQVANNLAFATQTAQGTLAYLGYVNDGLVQGNQIYGYIAGSYFWGGDANANGIPTNTRYARNIRMIGNYANGSGAGFWGSMGQNVTIEGNTVENIGDVGIDFEGCQGCTASGNTASNCGTTTGAACGSVFFYNLGVVFSHNVFRQPFAVHPIWRMYNAAGQYNADIQLNNNEFICDDPVNTCVVDNAQGPSNFLKIIGNVFTNTRLDVSLANNQQVTTVENNMMNFTQGYTIAAGQAALKIQQVGGFIGTVQNNVVEAYGGYSTAPQAGIGILATDNGTGGNQYRIYGNTIRFFATAIQVQTLGTASYADFYVNDNHMTNGVFVRNTGTTAEGSYVKLERNKVGGNFNNEANYPGSLADVTGASWNWETGQRIEYNTVADGQTQGAICTSGPCNGTTTGTWREFSSVMQNALGETFLGTSFYSGLFDNTQRSNIFGGAFTGTGTLFYTVAYLGINANRKANATFDCGTDGINNGCSWIGGNVAGSLSFWSVPSTASGGTGASPQNVTDTTMLNNLVMTVNPGIITMNKGPGVGAGGGWTGSISLSAATSGTQSYTQFYNSVPLCFATVQGTTTAYASCNVNNSTKVVTVTTGSTFTGVVAWMLVGNPN